MAKPNQKLTAMNIFRFTPRVCHLFDPPWSSLYVASLYLNTLHVLFLYFPSICKALTSKHCDWSVAGATQTAICNLKQVKDVNFGLSYKDA